MSLAPAAGRLDPPYGAADSGGMAARVDGAAVQIEQALEQSREVPRLDGGGTGVLAVGAMGGSAIAAELSAAWLADRVTRPMLVVRDYRWPACVTRGSFAILSSYSGNTEETLALYEEAGRRGAARAALTSGGTLAAACDRDGVPWMRLPLGWPPRAALFHGWVPLTRLIHASGACEDPEPVWREAAREAARITAESGISVPESSNPIKQLARELVGRHLFLYAGPGSMAAVATRLRQQLNENAKLLGHSAVVPELNHNEIVGWERPTELHRAVTVLVLRDPEDPPAIARRLELTAGYAAEQGAQVRVLEPRPSGRLARMVAQVVFGDYLSLYLALARGVDPTPIPSIDSFKRRLAESPAPQTETR